MRHTNGFLLLWTILWCLLSTTPSLILAVPSVTNHRPPPPFQIPVFPQQASSSRRPWSRVRDHIIRIIWRIPERRQDGGCSGKADLSKNLPGPKQSARYGGDVVLRFKIHTAEEASALAEASNILFLDVWEFTKEWVDVRLAKEVVPSLLGLLPSSLRHAHTPLMHDLAQTIYESYPSPTTTDSAPQTLEDHRAFSPSLRTTPDSESNIFFRNYQPMSVIVPWMRLLQSLFPSHVRMINIGITYEGRDIPALRIGVHPNNSEKPSAPRKSIIIAGGAHAREWISTSTVNYIAYSLVTSYGKTRSMTKLLEDFDWILIPTLNPDGYIYTWEHDRLWRKNRQQTSLRFCQGIDLDKAYDFKWDGEATAGNPCSESFAGDEPFQGVESRRFADWARNETANNNVEFVGFLDLHSYSQNVLYPYSYSCDSTPPSLENLEELATGLAKAMRLSQGETYGVNSACEGSVTPGQRRNREIAWPRMESGGGSALDWFYHELRVQYAFQIKLRDTGSYGFLLPSNNIIPTGKEALSAVTYFGDFLLGGKAFDQEEELVKPAPETEGGPWNDHLARVAIGHKSMENLESHGDENTEELMEDSVGADSMGWELKGRRRR